ncbi:MAG: DUF5615 family PIN-like protein [Ekhidna sp.]|uniref:DUF5615 family PIN-like protein n=1 Tax=Ekhidna sp. TaxID=2608089 RepID=UPI0032EB8B4A
MILADENIDSRLVSFLRENGIKVAHVKEVRPGISDKEVIEISKNTSQIILTEDKDFGEWVYAHKEKSISVILLRYSSQAKLISKVLVDLIKSKNEDLIGKFSIVTANKIRIRSIK